MRGTRISLLAVSALVAGVLGAPPASASDPAGTRALFTASPSGVPLGLDPITRTASGLVWRVAGDPYLWVWGSRLRRGGFVDAQSVGDLLSHHDSSADTFVYQTIADASRTSPITPDTVAIPRISPTWPPRARATSLSAEPGRTNWCRWTSWTTPGRPSSARRRSRSPR